MQTKKRAKPIQFGKKEVVTTKESADETKEVIQKGDTEIVVSVKDEEVEARIHTTGAKEQSNDQEEQEVSQEKEEEKKSSVLTKEQLAAQSEEYMRLTEGKESSDEGASTQSSLELDSRISGNDKRESEEYDEDDINVDSESQSQEESARVQHDPNNFAFTEVEDVSTEKKHSFLFYCFIAFIAFLVGLGGIAGGYYFVKDNHFELPSFSLASIPFLSEPTPTPEPSPTATPEPKEVDLAAYTIRVLNGSGITGKAATLKTQLTDEGYSVGETGNADNNEYTKTVISAQTSVEEAYIQKLKTFLQTTYQVDSTVKTIPSVGDTQVTITIGSETAK